MEKPKKPIAIISEENNDNVFSLVGVCKRALIDAGMRDEAQEMANRVYASNSFGEEAKKIMAEYCELK